MLLEKSFLLWVRQGEVQGLLVLKKMARMISSREMVMLAKAMELEKALCMSLMGKVMAKELRRTPRRGIVVLICVATFVRGSLNSGATLTATFEICTLRRLSLIHI